MTKNLDDDLFLNDDIIIVNKDCNNITFFSDQMGILSVCLDSSNLDNVNFGEKDPETIMHARLMARYNRLK